jgi:hypothetical protein
VSCRSVIGRDWDIKLLRVKFSVRGIMLAVACVALAVGVCMPCLRWLVYPHVTVTIFNETSSALREVRIKFLYGVRNAERIEPGGSAITDIQSGGEAGVFLSYRDSSGILIVDEPIHYSDERGAPDRGFLEVHVTKTGTRLDRGIYTAIWFEFPVWRIQVSPTGRMNVR